MISIKKLHTVKGSRDKMFSVQYFFEPLCHLESASITRGACTWMYTRGITEHGCE